MHRYARLREGLYKRSPIRGARKRGTTVSAHALTAKRARLLRERLKDAPSFEAGFGAGIPPLAEDVTPAGSKPAARSGAEKMRKQAKNRAAKKKRAAQGTGNQNYAAVASRTHKWIADSAVREREGRLGRTPACSEVLTA